MTNKQQILALRSQGMTYRQIAQSVGVSFQWVSIICGERPDRRLWRKQGGERVAAVGRELACFDRRRSCRAPQQGVVLIGTHHATGLPYETLFATEV